MDAEEALGTESNELAGKSGLPAHRCAAGDEKNDAANEHHRAQRGDEGIDVEESNDEAVGEPDRRAGDDPGDNARRDAGLEHDHAGDAARERGGRTDGEIEAAADNDEGHAHGDHGHDR